MSSMSSVLKLTFQLTAYNERLLIRVVSSIGEGKAETVVPPQILLDRLTSYDLASIPLSALERVGKTLYQCLTVGDVGKLTAEALYSGTKQKQPVQFELRFDADQVSLARYPWEMITDNRGGFLVRDGVVDMTRYINYPQPPATFDVALREASLLQVTAQPGTLLSALSADLVGKTETLQHATFEQFRRRLLIDRIKLWGLQFDGHGALLQQCGECDAVDVLHTPNCQKCGALLSGAKQVSALAFEHDDGGID